MVVTAVVAMITAAAIEVEMSRKRVARYASARRSFHAYEVYFEEGRVTLEEYVRRSGRLPEAELALCWTKGEQVAAIKAHLARASLLIEEEINRPLELHTVDERASDIAAANGSLMEWRARLSSLVRSR